MSILYLCPHCGTIVATLSLEKDYEEYLLCSECEAKLKDAYDRLVKKRKGG